MKKVLVVVDAQEDFTRGALKNDEAVKALPVIKNIVDFAGENGIEIIFTKDTHQENYLETLEGKHLPVVHCVKNTPGWELCEEVIPTKDYHILEKPTFGSNMWAGIPEVKEADEVWLCGFCTDICVSANYQTIKATYPEKLITVFCDACAGVTPELHEAALKVMASCHANVIKWEDYDKENSDEA